MGKYIFLVACDDKRWLGGVILIVQEEMLHNFKAEDSLEMFLLVGFLVGSVNNSEIVIKGALEKIVETGIKK